MKNILLAIDNTKGAEQAAQTVIGWASTFQPESICLLHVQRLFGWSKVGEGLESDQDIEEINKALEDSEQMQKLSKASTKLISYFTNKLEQAGFSNIKPIIKQGHPAEQIISTAKEEGVDLIVVGSRGGRFHSLLLGSVSREVANTADVSVLVAR